MTLTDFHSKYFAYELTKRCPSDSVEKLAGALVDAKVDLNPHQVDAALFAFRSPLSKGALLADEVGLGKTIEAGLVLSQKWAERKKRMLVITPANLRKQWHQELQEKFFLPCRILESKSYNEAAKKGIARPFENFESITICSYQFARAKAAELSIIPWDLVVFDEAHRLRNVYKPTNVIARALKTALGPAPKMLLTATPLQNSLLELYGLVSFIDDHIFGDLQSFRDQFTNLSEGPTFDALKARIQPICHRTLRRQVQAYVSYTARHAILEEFTPHESEDRLYNLVSEYLQRDNLVALPKPQRKLMTLVLRKLLASSTFAIAGALNTLTVRLKAQVAAQTPAESLEDNLDKDFETLSETAEDWDDDANAPMSEEDIASMTQEIKDLEEFRDLATSIGNNAKGAALLIALDKAFSYAQTLESSKKAKRKAIIFTESRKTQDYLQRILGESSYAGGVVLFNGTNTDLHSRNIYEGWLHRHKGSDRITGSRTADMRSALVEEFEQRAQIMIATEAGSEGINLQFCSLVVNYDLPWNPQRIEQRIGRCHRYGQENDVVVVNFLNRKNEADQLVYRLLAEKFSLFKGVFGSSDEVLGSIESGVDFEKRIAAIYQKCRTAEEIRASFKLLQAELSSQIDEAMSKTRQQLMENFDSQVHEKLRMTKYRSEEHLSRYEQILLKLTKHELGSKCEEVREGAFRLSENPFPGVRGIDLGLYELPRRSGDAHLYRLSHPLAQRLIQLSKSRTLRNSELVLDATNGRPSITSLRHCVGRSGELVVTQFTLESPDFAEDYIQVVAATDDDEPLEAQDARRLFELPVLEQREHFGRLPNSFMAGEKTRSEQEDIWARVSRQRARVFEDEASKLDRWADDLKLGLEREIKEIDSQIKEAKRSSSVAASLEGKLESQRRLREFEKLRNAKRKSLFEAQDEIDLRRGLLIEDLEKKLACKSISKQILVLRWSLR